jgi:hypothetical protein
VIRRIVNKGYYDTQADHSAVVVVNKSQPLQSFAATRTIEPTIGKSGFYVWMELFGSVRTLEQLEAWEATIPSYDCKCRDFYEQFKAEHPPVEPVSLQWKWSLRTAVNAKLDKPNLSLEQARWLYRFTERTGPVHHLVTLKDLIEDTKHLTRLIYSRHPNIAGIAGVARSGMIPATQIALDLGVDLYEATVDGCGLVSGGVRRTGTLHGERRKDDGPIVIVDDSTCSGYAWDRLKHLGHPFYTVYAGNHGKRVVDGYVVPLELPHFFEWNLFHNGIVMNNCKAAFDLDGVFCEDCPIDCDDDGPRYIDWMKRVQPLQWSIEYEVPLIMTARREVYREQALDWLKRHGIRVKEIVMFPGSFDERSRTNLGQWKASIAKERGCGLFVESDYRQACEIAKALPDCQVVSVERPTTEKRWI